MSKYNRQIKAEIFNSAGRTTVRLYITKEDWATLASDDTK